MISSVIREKGSITVFLTMIMLSVLALAGTVMESARVHTAWRIGDRALLTAMDSQLTEYYRPLYEDYHLFFLNKGVDTDTMNGEELLSSIEEYLIYTFRPEENLKYLNGILSVPNMDLYQLSLADLKMGRITKAVDYNGNIVINEAVEYMKYKSPASLVFDFKNQFKQFEEAGKSSEVIGKKLAAEESLSELNKDMLEIMELTEGLSSGRKGLKYGINGKIKTEKSFIKKFCPEGISAAALGIENSLVYESLRERYLAPNQMLQNMKKEIANIEKWRERVESLRESLALLETAEDSGEEGSGEEEESKAGSRRVLIDEIESLEQSIEKSSSYVLRQKKSINNTAKEIIKKIDRAVEIIGGLQVKQEKAEAELGKFEVSLHENKEEISQSIYEGLSEDLKAHKEYVGLEKSSDKSKSVIGSILAMKPILLENREILLQILLLEEQDSSNESGGLWYLNGWIDEAGTLMKGYRVKELRFSYGNLIHNKDVNNPLEALQSILSSSILELLVEDPSALSEKTMDDPDSLYQSCMGEQNGNETKTKDYGELLKDSDKKGYHGEMAGSFDGLGDSYEFLDSLQASTDACMQKLLVYEYGKEHFKSYLSPNEIPKKDGKENEKETVLHYEREYLIGGKAGDEDNLLAVTNQILFFRTVANFISILGDREKRNITYGTAAALVGFTGLEPLIRLTQTLILIGWSFEEAMIDTKALLDGKKIPFLKEGKKFSIAYHELFLFNKQMIRDKVSKLEDDPAGLGFSYDDYIRLFFLMQGSEKNSFRMMDLIENNIRLRYKHEFSMKHCIYGIQTEAEFTVPAKFISLPFVSKRLENGVKGWRHKVNLEYSY